MPAQATTATARAVMLLLAALTFPVLPAALAEPHQHASPEAGVAQAYTRRMERYEIPQVTLLRPDGQATSLADELDPGQSVILNFIFTSCRAVCPVMTGTFAALQERLGEQRSRVRLVSISIDPEYDTPDRLLEYARKYGADADWHFLTGALPDIVAVQNAFDAYRGNKMNHVPLAFIRPAGQAHWLRIEGFADAGSLVDEYRRLLSR